MKLGKLAPRHDPRTLRFANYAAALPITPTACHYQVRVKAPWGMMRNDDVGDCTCAAAGHAEQLWTACAATEFTPTDAQILTAYAGVTNPPYDPATGANDNGANMLDVLKYWRTTGIAGRKIDSFTSVAPTHTGHVRAAVYLFGTVYVGLSLPLTAQAQVGSLWTVGFGADAQPGSWGGHAVNVVAYDRSTVTVVTWGQLQVMTWAFWLAYCDEAYAVLSADWLRASGTSIAGFDLVALSADLGAVT
jgi:hypothetical protein